MRITFAEVQRNLVEIANRQSYGIDVLYELMAAYGRSASSITKLRNGVINLADNKDTTMLQKGVVYFKNVIKSDSLPAEVEKLEQDPLTARYNPRFLIATDLVSFAAKDTKKGNTLQIKWADIDKNVDFFYGWTGDEVVDEKTEAAADRRAADKMKELYFEVEKVNADRLSEKNSNFRHELNVFFTRLLFCFFAEDTHVFSRENNSIFTHTIRDFTQSDGSDLQQFLDTLFGAFDTKDKSEYTSPFSNFPYVNGSLFDKKKGISIPKFNAQARKLILDCGSISWAEINPDIFGSMFQSIVHDETNTMHYTSVPNIMKTIEPLFLDELREEFDKDYDNDNKLQKLWDRISKIKIFDPACGSGNFLIIAYKELRKLEHAIIDRVFEEGYKKVALAGKLTSRIDLNNFYGIEIDDFACEVAVLSLYIAKHQMNIEFEKQFGKRIELIPLADKANIVKANAARIDWQEVCPNKPRQVDNTDTKQGRLIADEYEQKELIDFEFKKEIWDEIYLISNPPYAGSRKQSKEEKSDMNFVFENGKDIHNYKMLDYVSVWFYKGASYLRGTKARLAFVSTNSICQGDQVGIFWPSVLNKIEIAYAFKSFKWENNAKNNAGVTCVIIGLRTNSNNKKYLYQNNIQQNVNNINAYLSSGENIIVQRRKKAISKCLPPMSSGNYTGHATRLTLNKSEYVELLARYPNANNFIKKLVGSDELIQGVDRWCIWISEAQLNDALMIPEIAVRVEDTKNARLKSKDPAANRLAKRPYQFRDTKTTNTFSVVIPIISSENRKYIPIGIIGNDTILSNRVVAIYDTDIFMFALLTSAMHMSWLGAVCGRLETRFSYSVEICYNTFPIRQFNSEEIDLLNESAKKILFVRENHSEKTLAELYDPDKMPDDLREAHHRNDILVDRLYRQKPYENDEDRLADLFALYKKMTSQEN